MKNFKLKICSLVLCICMCLTILSGCGLFVEKKGFNGDEVVMEVGARKITRQQLVDKYNSFYQQNYYYFMYYEEDFILDTFYNSVISREVVLNDADELIQEGKMVFSQEALDGVWEDIYDAILAQVDAKEKSLLLLENGQDEEKLPERLQTSSSSNSETAYKYKKYEADPVEKYDATKPKAVEYDIDDKIAELDDVILTYNENANKTDEDRKMVAIPEAEQAKRLEAYQMFLSDLILAAKAEGKSSNVDVVLKDQIQKLYDSYYENAIYDEYKNYINSTVIGTDDGEYENKLNNLALAEKYRQLYVVSEASNHLEDNYVSVIGDSSNSNLILYHYQGKYVYFTVQHILVKFSDEVVNELKTVKGYDTSKDAIFRDYYEAIRATYAKPDELSTTQRDTNPESETYGYIMKDADGKELKFTINEIIDMYNTEVADLIGEETDPAKISRIRTTLFQEYVYKFSDDTGSLSDSLATVLGLAISSETDNHGSYVKDFANGAREMFEAYKADPSTNGVGMQIGTYTSDYGVHIMMLTGVYDYDNGAIIDLKSLSGTTEAEKADALVEILRTTYVSSLTDETIYDYVYDILKNELVGDNGKYFSDHLNALVKEYKSSEKIKYIDKMTYKQLNDAIK